MLRWLFPTFVKGWTPTIFCFAAAPSDSDVEGTFRRQRKRRRAETASARKRRRKGPMPPPDAKPGGQTGHGRRNIIEHLLPADLSNVQVFQFHLRVFASGSCRTHVIRDGPEPGGAAVTADSIWHPPAPGELFSELG